MKTYPIIFTGPMVRALLEGRKTQTRRIIKPQSIFEGKDAIIHRFPNQQGCPYGRPDDLLWVRETWRTQSYSYADKDKDFSEFQYLASWPEGCEKNVQWKPSIHMPRRASRLTLEITDVRAERLQEINHVDAMAEGIKHAIDMLPLIRLSSDEFAAAHTKAADAAAREAYKELWNSIHGPSAWEDNPWVWVLTFHLHHCNVDDFTSRKTS